MREYFIKRLLLSVPLLFGISLLTFLVMHLAPGKPTDMQVQLNQKVSLSVRERMEKLYGLDKPLPVQYWQWLRGMLTLDMGTSFIDGRPVREKILERLPVTLSINLLILALMYACAVPLGIFSAVREGSLFDRCTGVALLIAYSVPTFWLALLLMRLFSVVLGWLPASGIRSLDFEYLGFGQKIIDYARHITLPVLISAFTGLAALSRYMRTSMLGVLRQDYIRTARAKGVPAARIYFHHALKNSLLPVITLLGLSVPGLIGGSVIAESIFALPGMGKLFYDAVMSRDYPLIMGLLNFGALLTLAGNFLADIGYAVADPRIRLAGRA
ncbi:MAG: ABC transporter permease [Candidatus Omnitrophica bacterium]|nr:ABC transporter permease [Candidatus Omnitrophota bacterium]